MSRWSEHRWVALLKSGLVPVALGLILVSGLTMMQTADHSALTVAISLATAGFVVTSRRNPLWAVVAGSCLELVAWSVGLTG